MLQAAAIIVACLGLGGAVYALRQSRGSRRALAVANERLARIDATIPGENEDIPVGREALRRDVRVSFEAREVEHDQALLTNLLEDFRDVAGAEEAIFWRWRADRDSLTPAVWSSTAPRPAFFDMQEWGPLVQWSAETGVVQTVGHDDATHVAAACVKRDDVLLGVLSLTHTEGLGLPRPALKEWMPRLAAQLATFSDLLGARRGYSRHMRQSQALLDAVQRLQSDRGGEGLARALCETALDVSGARGAVLVRWDGDADVGEVHYATEGTGLRAPTPLESGSVVAEACRTGKLHVLEDSRGAASGQALYGAARVIREPGSVAIIPVAKGGRVLGALVLEADEVGALTAEDARPLTVLGAVVAGSLEMAWQFAEVDRRARTDALTGLWNRMHFGEQLTRILAEADRYEHPVSMVLMDIDHFKKVNDTWGHEAGDAVLKQVARVLQDGVRAVDICVRYGGEEIAMLLAQTDSAHAVEVAERLRVRVSETPVKHGPSEIRVTASFGVATYPETVKVRDQLFPAADKALYIAKHDGRNCVRAKPAGKGRATS
ncbi:MAG: sensor domain-containing diguanylate cyclase [Gemmatimonadota bacterium]|nr:sensor domain-containing diguanylate cyclase [Gemmatimonadota bacterium]